MQQDRIKLRTEKHQYYRCYRIQENLCRRRNKVIDDQKKEINDQNKVIDDQKKVIEDLEKQGTVFYAVLLKI